jgi:hypothetical protein
MNLSEWIERLRPCRKGSEAGGKEKPARRQQSAGRKKQVARVRSLGAMAYVPKVFLLTGGLVTGDQLAQTLQRCFAL